MTKILVLTSSWSRLIRDVTGREKELDHKLMTDWLSRCSWVFVIRQVLECEASECWTRPRSSRRFVWCRSWVQIRPWPTTACKQICSLDACCEVSRVYQVRTFLQELHRASCSCNGDLPLATRCRLSYPILSVCTQCSPQSPIDQ